MVGDFNAKHPSWGVSAFADPRGRRVAEWAAEQGLRPALRNEATHNREGTLNLVFRGQQAITARVAGELEYGSDHRVVWTETAVSGSVPPAKWVVPERCHKGFA